MMSFKNCATEPEAGGARRQRGRLSEEEEGEEVGEPEEEEETGCNQKAAVADSDAEDYDDV